MVLGDYYAARVRPTASSAPGTRSLRSSLFFFSPLFLVRSPALLPFGFAAFFASVCACTYRRASIGTPTGARTDPPEQKARKQNAIMISPEDGWSKLPRRLHSCTERSIHFPKAAFLLGRDYAKIATICEKSLKDETRETAKAPRVERR